ncbi:MAG: alpha-glucan family phosphorylase [Acidobacteriota bacterium]
MSEFKRFNVVPVLPETLLPLTTISENLWYCWNHEAFRLFRDINAELWHSTNHNPVKVLKEAGQDRLNELAENKEYVVLVNKVADKLKEYISENSKSADKDHSIAYFSAEYGLTEALPIYSGGLGVLSGDHIKSASDLNLNLSGIGLLYQEGYFQQKLDKNGWQQDYYRVNDFSSMPLHDVYDGNGAPLIVEVLLENIPVYLKVWRIDTGRVAIYMLDSNIENNSEQNKKLTAHLYGGDKEHRLRQEIVLGIGGMKVLKELGIQPDVIHINEGHSAFALFERAMQFMDKYNLETRYAMELSKKSAVFTTHTPVAAGNDEFSSDMMKRYFSGYSQKLGIAINDFIELGKDPGNKHKSDFSMTIAAIRNSAFVNGVSELHGNVAGKMWNHLWPDTPFEHTPINFVTNGIHIQSWISGEMKVLLDKYMGENWPYVKNNGNIADLIKSIPDEKLWNIKQIRKAKLIDYVRKKVNDQLREKGIFNKTSKELDNILDPNALTIGFARRFASYKRGDLIFRDKERLRKILFNNEKPVQIIIAGKAHPQDNPGKEIIKRISGFINSDDTGLRVVFLENYNINIGRYLVQGVDLWLNNPIRLFEASGTSGMKTVVNGGLNLSVLDGWWDEGFNGINGWAVGERIPIEDPQFRDDVESDSIYSVLEEEIVPLFFERDNGGIPSGWMDRVKNSIATLSPRFNTYRMVNEYNEKFYINASRNFKKLKEDNFKALQDFTNWKELVKREFKNIRITDISYDDKQNFSVGEQLDVGVAVEHPGLDPADLKVEVYFGKIEREDQLLSSELAGLDQTKDINGGGTLFSGGIVCTETGSLGFKIRITPKHELMNNGMELNLVKWG